MDKQILVFEVIEDMETCKQREIDYPLLENFKSDSIYIIVDPFNKEVWIWNGKNANIRLKFIAAKIAPSIRDQHGIDYMITAIDEDYEDKAFKNLVET